MQEENPLKAVNSFAIRDIIDGVDVPLIVLEAKVWITIEVSAVFLVIGVTGGLTARAGELRFCLAYSCPCNSPLLTVWSVFMFVEIDLYDPFPDTSGGLVRYY